MARNFERELPSGYSRVYHIDAADKKTGLALNGICLLITALFVVLALIPLNFSLTLRFDLEGAAALMVFGIGMIAYIVLHELTHGAAYKILTKEKLTFGFKWSCAFCGVPDVFVYRRASMIALAAPLVIFTLVLAPLAAALFFVSEAVYFAVAVLLAYHLGGCVGDGYMLILFLFKFKNEATLIRDTGPEQFVYAPAEPPLAEERIQE